MGKATKMRTLSGAENAAKAFPKIGDIVNVPCVPLENQAGRTRTKWVDAKGHGKARWVAVGKGDFFLVLARLVSRVDGRHYVTAVVTDVDLVGRVATLHVLAMNERLVLVQIAVDRLVEAKLADLTSRTVTGGEAARKDLYLIGRMSEAEEKKA